MVFNNNLHHNVLKLDVHHSSHCLLLGPHQSGTEDHSQVGHSHHIFVAVRGHPAHTQTHRHANSGQFYLWQTNRKNIKQSIMKSKCAYLRRWLVKRSNIVLFFSGNLCTRAWMALTLWFSSSYPLNKHRVHREGCDLLLFTSHTIREVTVSI